MISYDIFSPDEPMNMIFASHTRNRRISRRKIVFEESGLGMIEYALIVALIMLVGVVGMSTLAQQGINPTLTTAKEGLELASS